MIKPLDEMTIEERMAHASDLCQENRKHSTGEDVYGKLTYGYGKVDDDGVFDYPIAIWIVEGQSARLPKPAPVQSNGKSRKARKERR